MKQVPIVKLWKIIFQKQNVETITANGLYVYFNVKCNLVLTSAIAIRKTEVGSRLGEMMDEKADRKRHTWNKFIKAAFDTVIIYTN